MAHSFPTRRFSDLNRAGAGLRRPHGVLPDRTATRGTPARRPVRAPVVLFVRPVSDHAPADRRGPRPPSSGAPDRSEEHTSELQSLMRISYAVFCLKKKKTPPAVINNTTQII